MAIISVMFLKNKLIWNTNSYRNHVLPVFSNFSDKHGIYHVAYSSSKTRKKPHCDQVIHIICNYDQNPRNLDIQTPHKFTKTLPRHSFCLTICGITAMYAVHFRPYRSAIHPDTMFPTTPPRQSVAPIQAPSSVEMGPLGSGEFSDCRIGIEGDIHPELEP